MAKRRRTNYFYSIISVALVLFLLGFFGTALLFVQQQATMQQSKITMMIEIKEGADSVALTSLKQELPQMSFVKQGSVKFVSKQEAAEIMRESLGDTLINPDMPLPFYDAYSISLTPESMNKESIADITLKLKDNIAVNDVYMDEGLMGDVSKTIEKIALFAFVAALLFIIVALTLIHNTIRINLYSDRFIIKNMELVGASWRFITRPYIRKGIRNGIISGVLAVVMIALIWFFIQKSTPELNLLLQSPVFLCSAMALILLGVVISWLSTFYVVNKYLKMRLDDLY